MCLSVLYPRPMQRQDLPDKYTAPTVRARISTPVGILTTVAGLLTILVFIFPEFSPVDISWLIRAISLGVFVALLSLSAYLVSFKQLASVASGRYREYPALHDAAIRAIDAYHSKFSEAERISQKLQEVRTRLRESSDQEKQLQDKVLEFTQKVSGDFTSFMLNAMYQEQDHRSLQQLILEAATSGGYAQTFAVHKASRQKAAIYVTIGDPQEQLGAGDTVAVVDTEQLHKVGTFTVTRRQEEFCFAREAKFEEVDDVESSFREEVMTATGIDTLPTKVAIIIEKKEIEYVR